MYAVAFEIRELFARIKAFIELREVNLGIGAFSVDFRMGQDAIPKHHSDMIL